MPNRKVGDVPGGRPIVLYVEDDDLNQRVMYQAIHRHFAVDVVMAPTAHEGVVAALSLVPPLILLDLGLPDADGATVLSALRNHPRTATLPIYVVTADATERRRLELLEAGASGYITKPFNLHAIDDLLDQAGLPRV